MKIGELLDSLGSDLRRAARSLSRRRAFTLATVITLALGIGATTAIFSVAYSVLWRPLPYPSSDELVRIRHSVAGNLGGADFEPTLYLTYRDENRTLADIGLWQEGGATLTDRGEPQRVRALRVTDGTLRAIGAQPKVGRGFTAAEYGNTAEGPAPVILSYAFWQRHFAGDDAAMGRPLEIDSRPSQVVGIMPPDFRFLDATPQPDLIIAAQLAPFGKLMITGAFAYGGLARLRPGVTPAEAHADLERMLPLWRETWPLPPPETGLTRDVLEDFQLAPLVRPLKDDLVGDVASMLWVLMGAIGAALVVACANIANLMLVRGDERRQDLAICAALGARPAQVVRVSLVESTVIGAAGSALGLLLAYVGVQALVAAGPQDLPRLQEIAVYPPVLLFTAAVALASTLLFGSITALKQLRDIGKHSTLSARGSSTSREHAAARNTLIVVQVALALMLVVSAALMIRTSIALSNVDPGFTLPNTIQTARIWMPSAVYPDPERYVRVQREILDSIERMPGVERAGFTNQLPMEGQHNNSPVIVEGETPVGGTTPQRWNKFVSPGYFAAMGTRIIAGRDITWDDIEAGGRVVLISEEFARQLAAEPAGAIGKRVRTFFENDAWREVVGVVQSVRENGIYENAESFVYWPVLAKDMWAAPVIGVSAAALTIRSERAGTATFTEELQQAIRSVSGSIPMSSERTMQDLYSQSFARTSFTLVMLAISGGMALLLGVIGIYGVIAYIVAQRAREIGIRSALGADPRRLVGMFLRQGLALSAVGVGIGVIGAAALGRLMSSLLYGVEPMDPVAYVGAIAVLFAAVALATYLPARRAASIDPMATLRAE